LSDSLRLAFVDREATCLFRRSFSLKTRLQYDEDPQESKVRVGDDVPPQIAKNWPPIRLRWPSDLASLLSLSTHALSL
jgi:hypothetical protein